MANYKTCRECNSALLDDDIAIYRKLIYRGADEFLCIDCLGICNVRFSWKYGLC